MLRRSRFSWEVVFPERFSAHWFQCKVKFWEPENTVFMGRWSFQRGFIIYHYSGSWSIHPMRQGWRVLCLWNWGLWAATSVISKLDKNQLQSLLSALPYINALSSHDWSHFHTNLLHICGVRFAEILAKIKGHNQLHYFRWYYGWKLWPMLAYPGNCWAWREIHATTALSSPGLDWKLQWLLLEVVQFQRHVRWCPNPNDKLLSWSASCTLLDACYSIFFTHELI